jgi:hypothetical protein
VRYIRVIHIANITLSFSITGSLIAEKILADPLSTRVKAFVSFVNNICTAVVQVEKLCIIFNCAADKDNRRNWYKGENAPLWWSRTGLRFQSANHPKRMATTICFAAIE